MDHEKRIAALTDQFVADLLHALQEQMATQVVGSTQPPPRTSPGAARLSSPRPGRVRVRQDGRPEFRRGAPDRRLLVLHLRRNKGNVVATAQELKCGRNTLYKWLSEADLALEDFRGHAPDRDVLEGHLARHKGNVTAVANDLDVRRPQVHSWIRRWGIVVANYRGLHRDDVVAQLEHHGGSVSDTARALGCSRGWLHRWIKSAGIALGPFRKGGRRSPRTRLPREIDMVKLERRRKKIMVHLKRTSGNVWHAAKAMGCSRGALHRWINEAGIRTADFRRAAGRTHGDHADSSKKS